MSKQKTVEEGLDFLKQQIGGGVAGMIAEMVVKGLKETLGEEALNKEVNEHE